MTDTMKLDPPSVETMPDRRIVGTKARYMVKTRGGISGQWDAHMMQGFESEGADPSRRFGLCDAFGGAVTATTSPGPTGRATISGAHSRMWRASGAWWDTKAIT